MDWWQDLVTQNYDWFWEAGLTSLITLTASLSWHYLHKKIDSFIVKSKNRWDDIALHAFGTPVNWLIVIIGASWFADITARHFAADIIESIPIARQLAVLIIIAWGTWRLITGIEEKQLDKGHDPTTVQLVGKVTKLAVIILIIMPIFQILGISISGMLAFGGMGGLIVGMAAKDGALFLELDAEVMDPEDGAIQGFAIAGEDRRFQPAEVAYVQEGEDDRGRPRLYRRRLVLTSPLVGEPVHFRYAWGRNPMGNLQVTGNKDLPFATQRSDDWDMGTVPLGVLDSKIDGAMTRKQRNQVLKALRAEDVRRRAAEARATLGEGGD